MNPSKEIPGSRVTRAALPSPPPRLQPAQPPRASSWPSGSAFPEVFPSGSQHQHRPPEQAPGPRGRPSPSVFPGSQHASTGLQSKPPGPPWPALPGGVPRFTATLCALFRGVVLGEAFAKYFLTCLFSFLFTNAPKSSHACSESAWRPGQRAVQPRQPP